MDSMEGESGSDSERALNMEDSEDGLSMGTGSLMGRADDRYGGRITLAMEERREWEGRMASWARSQEVDVDVRWVVVAKVGRWIRGQRFQFKRDQYDVVMNNLEWFRGRVFVTMDQVAHDEFGEVTRGWSVWVDERGVGDVGKVCTVDYGDHAFRLAMEYVISSV